MISFLYKKERKNVHSVHSLEARVGIAGAQIKTYRYSPCVLSTIPYTCSGKNSYAKTVLNKTKQL